jgi:hypothetical protein
LFIRDNGGSKPPPYEEKEVFLLLCVTPHENFSHKTNGNRPAAFFRGASKTDHRGREVLR